MSFLLTLLLTFAPMASTHIGKDAKFIYDGGWMPNNTHLVSSYKSNTIFRIKYEKILKQHEQGDPDVKLLDSIDLAINPKKGLDYYILGSFYCTSPNKDPNLVIALKREAIEKAWTVVNEKFKPVSTRGLKCDLAGLRE